MYQGSQPLPHSRTPLPLCCIVPLCPAGVEVEREHADCTLGVPSSVSCPGGLKKSPAPAHLSPQTMAGCGVILEAVHTVTAYPPRALVQAVPVSTAHRGQASTDTLGGTSVLSYQGLQPHPALPAALLSRCLSLKQPWG